MGRLADLLLADDVNTTEEAELIRLLDAVQLATNEVGGLFGPTGQISNLSAGYLVIDSSGIHTAKNEVVLDRKGLTFPEQSSGISYLRWTNSAGTRTAYIAKATSGSLTIENQEGGQDIFILNKETAGDQIFLRIGMTSSSTLGTISIREDPGQTDRLQVDLGVGAEGTKFTIGGEVVIFGGADSVETVFNENSRDIDFRIEGATVTDLLKVDAGNEQVSVGGFFSMKLLAELTIAAGAITVTGSYHLVDTQDNDASDDLDTISGGNTGDFLILEAADSGRTIVVKDGTGNIRTAGDFSLDTSHDRIMLHKSPGDWYELSRSDNA